MPTITFVLQDGSHKVCEAKEGETILSLVRRHKLNIIEGACEGSLACSTCHVIIAREWFDRVNAINCMSDEENDMLDLAFDLTETSRLGCQIKITAELDGLYVVIPKGSRNIVSEHS